MGAASSTNLYEACRQRTENTRLLDDSDGLFSGDDVIDETYEQYLSDLLALMERHDCTFKRAIELADSGQDSEKPLGEAMSGAGVSRPAEVYPVISSLVG